MSEDAAARVAQRLNSFVTVLQAVANQFDVESHQDLSIPKSYTGVSTTSMTPARILIINDDHQRGPELQDRLTSAGYEVLNASLSDSNAVEEVAELSPDLVLMDISSQGKTDGVRAADLIQTRLDIPVIYTMSNYGQATLQRSRATGPFGYIFEPLDAKQVASTIEVALVRNRLEREIKESRQWLSTVLSSIGDGVVAVDDRRLITFINPVAEALTGWAATEAVGRPLDQVFTVADDKAREIIHTTLANVIGVTRELQGNIHAMLTCRTGNEIPVEITISRMKMGKGAAKGMVLVFRDITERQRAMHEIRQQANRAEALVEVASQLNKQIELGTLLETVCVTTNRALKATGTAVLLVDPKTDAFQNRAAFSEVPLLKAFRGRKFEIRRDILARMLTHGHPVAVISDFHSIPELPYLPLLRQLRVRTLVIAALFIRDELMGTLVSVFADTQRNFCDDDVALLMGLADQASSAIENAELFEQVRKGRERQRVLAKSLVEVQESERRHVARELHDQLGQALTGLQFMLEGAKNQVQEEQRTNLDEIQKYVREIMQQTREISMSLRPSMLDDLGLLPTLQWHIDRYSRQTGIRVEFHCKGEAGRFPAAIETTAYRIIQEALTNVARYAQVQEVFVGLAVEEGALWLEIMDKGKGFDLALDPDKPTTGLGGMRERAALVGGYLVVSSFPGRGTQIVAALPLNGQVLERRRNERNRSSGG